MRVDELIELQGRDVVVKRLSADQPYSGEWSGEPVYDEFTVRVMIRSCNAMEREMLSGIESLEVFVLITATELKVQDVVVIDGAEYEVQHVEKVYDGSRVLYYKAYVAREPL